MNEIKVEPYIPDEDYDNPAMVVDFYEFTMANCLFLHGFKNTTLVFDMFFRKNPDNQGYSISAGQRKLTRFLLEYHFNEQDIHWLRTKGMSEEFCEYLRTYKWKGDMYALPEGTVCYPHVQMVRIECDLVGAILIETYLLQTMNFHSLIATKATRVTGLNTHTPRSVMEFGTRRAQGESAGNDGAYAAVLGGCIGTANCLAEMKFGSDVKAVGTVAHSFIEFFPTEFDAFKAFADTYPDSVSLSAGRTGRLRCADVLRHPHRFERRIAGMLIYLLRHGLTEYNAEKRYQGQRDIPLSAAGRAMLCRADISPKTVYITPLCRTRQTAEVLFPGARLVETDGLKEMCFGSFEGRNYIEMEHDPDYLAWVAANCESPCPDGETKAAFCERICAAFSALVDKALADGEEMLVILAHGGTQMAAMERYALPHKDYYEWCAPNAGGFVLDAKDWTAKRVLYLVKTVQYTKEAQA